MLKLKYLSLLLFVFVLTACSGAGQSSATPLPTVKIGGANGGASAQATSAGLGSASDVTASGVVVAAQKAQMAFTSGGTVKTVSVALGDQVKAGQVLAELDNISAQVALDQAKRNLTELTSTSAVAAAEQAVATAEQALKTAKDNSDKLGYARATDTLIQNTQGQIDLAKKQLARASDSYRGLSHLADGDGRKAAALVAMTDAQLLLNRLIAQYNWYAGQPTNIDADVARANLDAATANLQEARWYLSTLKGEQLPADATGANLTRLAQAKEAVATAQERLDGTRIVAPFDGTVAAVSVSVGDYVSPGVIVLVVSDVTRFHVETTDLSERDVPNVKLGQAVTVTIKALGKDVTGHVTSISPLADTLGGDVVYKTVIALDLPLPEGIRAGMSVDVAYQVK
jgi:HlyD family secretion protein